MTREIFFQKLQEECKTDEEYCVKLIEARGFIIQQDAQGNMYLSQENHIEDTTTLNKYLEHVGCVENGMVMLTTPYDYTYLENEAFPEEKEIGGDSVNIIRDWYYFKGYLKGVTVPLSWLEPFIARYVRAINACGVLTVGSCDGNHINKYELYLMPDGEESVRWHRLIYEECLRDRFHIVWKTFQPKNGHPRNITMTFIDGDKYGTYFELNKAAEFLYKNRGQILNIKAHAVAFVENNNVNPKDAIRVFIGEAKRLFEQCTFEE